MDSGKKVLVCGLLIGLAPLCLGLWPDSETNQLRGLLAGYGLSSILYLYVWRNWRHIENTRRGLIQLLVVSGVTRVLLLSMPLILSEDLWRYLWDGCVQWGGINPYLHAPNSSILDVVAGESGASHIRGLVGHPSIPTIYPPTAQLAFLFATGIEFGPLPLRTLFCLADLSTVFFLWRWSQALGRAPQAAALYALAPISILESAVGGHVDILGVAFLVAAGYWISVGRQGRGGIALAAAVGVKLIPIVTLPALIKRWPKATVATIVAMIVMAIPYLSAGPAALGGLKSYAHRWEGNGSLFAMIRFPLDSMWSEAGVVLDSPIPVSWVRALVGVSEGGDPTQVWSDELAFALAKICVICIFAIICLLVLRRAQDIQTIFPPIMMSLCLLTPILHPWYLLWVLPFAALSMGGPRTWWSEPVIVWSLLAWLAYLPRPNYIETGIWAADPLAAWIQYVPVFIFIGWNLWRRRSDGQPS